MVAPEVDMATVRFPTIIVFYLSEFRGSEGSLRYHVRGFDTVKELPTRVQFISIILNRGYLN